jgi:pimeloyl-ACP methyl ester carboxylesterase
VDVVLSGERVVEVWEGGDPGGRVVVYHHGTPAGRLQAVLWDEVAVRHGVRLVSLSRPGYGRSTDTPPSLMSVGEGTLAVADALGVGEFEVVGVSGGGPYAVATGLLAPRRVRAVHLLAGTGPWRLIEPPAESDPDAPILARADAGYVAGALEGFREQAAGEFDELLSLGHDELLARLFDDVPEAELADQESRLRWAADTRDALSSYDGFARDNVAWGGAWDIDPTQLAVPARLWYGDADRMVPASHGHWFAERIPQSTLVVRPGEGHLGMVFGHWDEILSADGVVAREP